MGTSIFLPLLFAVLWTSAFSAEKVLFGEPSSVAAEARQETDAAKETSPKSGRTARVFTFPGSSQQDSRTHQPAYVIPSTHFETTEDRFSGGVASGLEDENRLLSLLPTFGSNGMQVGLDFKLPFFSIPYAKMFSALTAPSVSGGLFGSNPAYISPSGNIGTLSTNLLGSGSSMSSSVATVAAMAATAALLYPKITGLFSLDGKGVFRDGSGAEDFLSNVNTVLHQFNIDGESCMKVALCSLGNAKRHHQRTRGRDASTTPADIVEDILNLPAVKSMLAKGALVQARDFGGTGGDCDYFNHEKKCPVGAQTFQKMLSTLG